MEGEGPSTTEPVVGRGIDESEAAVTGNEGTSDVAERVRCSTNGSKG